MIPYRKTRNHQSGSAMLMVLLILGVLIVISIPFLSSMARHAENARSYQADTRSEQLADLGLQSTSGILASGEVNQEWQRRNAASPDPESQTALGRWAFITPYMDYPAELRTMREQLAKFYLDGFQSRKSIGIQIEDEQGKLNLATAPDRVVNNLKSLLGPSDRIEQYVTRHSVRPSKHAITRNLPVSRADDNSEERRGSRVQWSTTRHPINVNTAHWKVIAANLIGLGKLNNVDEEDGEKIGKTMEEEDQFDPSISRKLAKFIKSKPPVNGWYQFEDVLDDADDEEMLSGAQKKMILRNARKGNLLYAHNRFDRNTSMPFCFRSYDTYSVQSRAATMNRAGSPLSEAGVRSVQFTSPGRTSYVIDSPYEFAESLAQLTESQGITRNNSYGVILGPRRIYRKLKNTTRSFENEELGTWNNTRILKERQTDVHFQPKPNDRGKFEPYGKEIGSDGIKQDDLLPNGSGYKTFSSPPGGVKFWVKFDGTPSATTLFDTAKSTYQSRIHFYYREGKLFLDAADPTVEKKYTRVVADWQPQADTWYHLGAFWKSTKYGHLAIMIDGHLVGEMKMVNEDDENLLRTVSSLSKEAPAAQLTSLEPGYWELGEEIVKVPGRTSDELTDEEMDNLNESNNRGLGRQPTTPHEHGEGSVANPYGFSIELDDNSISRSSNAGSYPHLDQQVNLKADLGGIPNFKIRTESAFGASARPTICPDDYRKEQGERVNCVPPEEEENEEWELGSSEQNIPVVFDRNDDPSDLPSPALLLIYGTISTGESKKGNGGNGSNSKDSEKKEEAKYEVVVCEEASENALSGCSRGVLGTEEVNWQAGADVELLGFPVDNADQFPASEKEGRIVQVDTEWIGPVKPYTTQGTTFLGSTSKKVPLQRRVIGTSIGGNGMHEINRKVLPVFSLEDEDPEDRNLPNVTMLEDVTLAYKPENQLKKERVTIRLSKFSNAALDDFVPDHVKAEGVNRLLKFPSGELLARGRRSSGEGEEESGSNQSAHLGTTSPNAEQIGSMSGVIANLESVSGSNQHLIADEPIDDATSSMVIRGNLDSVGALKVGDELIGFPESTSSQRLPIDEEKRPEDKTPEEIIEENDNYSENDLLQLTELTEVARGYLESTKASHNRGDRVFVLSQGMISVSALSDSLSPVESEVRVKDGNLFTGDYEYYRIDREILGAKGGNMPRHPLTNRGMFRGAYGTTPTTHSENTMVFRTPHRFPDRVPDEDLPRLYADLRFHVLDVNRPGATWTGLSWQAERDQQQGSAPRILVRTDRDTPWYKVEKRYNPTMGSSVQFKETTDQIELLFLFDYQDGAYSVENWRARHGWKSTTRINRLELKHRSPSRTFMHRKQK